MCRATEKPPWHAPCAACRPSFWHGGRPCAAPLPPSQSLGTGGPQKTRASFSCLAQRMAAAAPPLCMPTPARGRQSVVYQVRVPAGHARCGGAGASRAASSSHRMPRPCRPVHAKPPGRHRGHAGQPAWYSRAGAARAVWARVPPVPWRPGACTGLRKTKQARAAPPHQKAGRKTKTKTRSRRPQKSCGPRLARFNGKTKSDAAPLPG